MHQGGILRPKRHDGVILNQWCVQANKGNTYLYYRDEETLSHYYIQYFVTCETIPFEIKEAKQPQLPEARGNGSCHTEEIQKGVSYRTSNI